MARCGMGDRVCAGSWWVRIRPEAVNISSRKCYLRIAYRSNLAQISKNLARRRRGSSYRSGEIPGTGGDPGRRSACRRVSERRRQAGAEQSDFVWRG